MKPITFLAVIALSLISHYGEAAMKKNITFTSNGQSLVGHLYLPESYQDGMQLPAVVITGAWMTVKEQMPTNYAKALAEKGFAALVFDFRGWGESVDPIQYLEDPKRKTIDINSAVDFLATRPEVDPARIAGLGICASAGYMSDTAVRNSLVKSLALVAPWLHNREIVSEVYGGEKGVAALLDTARHASKADQPVILEAASTTNEHAVMYQAPYYTEADRGLIPEFDNKFNAASWQGWLTYDGIQNAAALTKPTLLIHSEAAAIPNGAKSYADLMANHAQTIWLDNVTQFDFYDRPDVLETAVDAVAAHFAKTL